MPGRVYKKEFLNCCRFCLLPFVIEADQTLIDEAIKEQFKQMTNLQVGFLLFFCIFVFIHNFYIFQLAISDEYSSACCNRCVHDLKSFILTKEKFLKTQLYLENECIGNESFVMDKSSDIKPRVVVSNECEEYETMEGNFRSRS